MKMTELERLVIRILGDNKQYLKSLTESANATTKFTSRISSSLNLMKLFTSGLTMAAGAMTMYGAAALSMAGLNGFNNVLQRSIKLAGEQEQSLISMSTMMGGGDKGDRQALALMKQMRDYAAKTPFTFPGIRNATQQMMQYGMSAKQAFEMTKMIGNVAGGDTNKLAGMGYAMAQISAAGKLMGQDLHQLINWGFNPLQEMSRTTGKSMAELMDMMHRGAISSEDVRKAFISATEAGGKFAGMNEKQSKTLLGLWSTLQDSIGFALTDIGEKLIATFHLKEILQFSIDQIDEWTKSIVSLTAWAANMINKYWGTVVGTLDWIWQGFKSLFKNIIGFAINWQHNLNVIIEWLKDNWLNMVVDLGRLWLNWQKQTIDNSFVMLNTLLRMWGILAGWIGGQFLRPLSSSFALLFVDLFPNWVYQGLAKSGTAFKDFALSIATDLALALSNPSAFAAKKGVGMITSFIQGAEDQIANGKDDLLDKMIQGFNTDNLSRDLAEEFIKGMKQMKTGLEDFKFNTKPIEGLITDLPEEMFGGIPQAGVDALEEATPPLVSAAGKLGHAMGKGLNGPVEAALYGSTQAWDHFLEFKERTNSNRDQFGFTGTVGSGMAKKGKVKKSPGGGGFTGEQWDAHWNSPQTSQGEEAEASKVAMEGWSKLATGIGRLVELAEAEAKKGTVKLTPSGLGTI